jgi:hypothetical protein
MKRLRYAKGKAGILRTGPNTVLLRDCIDQGYVLRPVGYYTTDTGDPRCEKHDSSLLVGISTTVEYNDPWGCRDGSE